MTAQTWGARYLGDGRTRFRLWAPGAASVTLEVEGLAGVELVPDAEGWVDVEAGAAPGDLYRYRLADGTAFPDPAARRLAGGVHGWSVVTSADDFAWGQRDWRGRPWPETVFLEVHAGLLGGFAGIQRRLKDWAALGVTAVQLMPVAAVSGGRNWGYDGVGPYAISEPLGAPDDLKALVDAAHGEGLMIFLDVVYNHFGPDGNYLPAYAPAFFDAEAQTPWGAAIAFQRAPVARFFIENAIYWLDEFRFDGLRFDAAHAIADNAFLDRLAAEVRRAIPDREIHLVLENEANDPVRLTTGFTAQWNDDFHNVMHVLLTAERHAYYQDFADTPAEALARSLAEGFIYQGQGSPNHDGRPRGAPSRHLPPTAFVNFLQNHDQVGNRALGERLNVLTSPERYRAALGLLLLAPPIPMLFMGEEDASETPFLFFTDFHDELADAVREGRRREFAKFPAFADPEQRLRIPDPNALATFETSVPAAGPGRDEQRALIKTLLTLRRQHVIPIGARAQSLGAVVIGPSAVVVRWALEDTVLTLAINLGDEAALDDDLPTTAPIIVVGERGENLGERPAASFAAWLDPAP